MVSGLVGIRERSLANWARVRGVFCMLTYMNLKIKIIVFYLSFMQCEQYSNFITIVFHLHLHIYSTFWFFHCRYNKKMQFIPETLIHKTAPDHRIHKSMAKVHRYGKISNGILTSRTLRICPDTRDTQRPDAAGSGEEMLSKVLSRSLHNVRNEFEGNSLI